MLDVSGSRIEYPVVLIYLGWSFQQVESLIKCNSKLYVLVPSLTSEI